MTTAPKLALFAISLAAVFGAGAGLGTLVGPISVGGSSVDHSTVIPGMQMPTSTVVPANGTGK